MKLAVLFYAFLQFLPLTKLRKGNVFKPVCHSVHRGVSASWSEGVYRPRQTPPKQTPLDRRPLGRNPLDRHLSPMQTPPIQPLKRAVRIPLECILVMNRLTWWTVCVDDCSSKWTITPPPPPPVPDPHALNYPFLRINRVQFYLYFNIVSTGTILLQNQYFELTSSDL